MFEDWSPVIGDSEISKKVIDEANKHLGQVIPDAYIDVLKRKNGGFLKNNFMLLNNKYKIMVSMLYGIGGREGIDAIVEGRVRNMDLIREWGYPNNSIIICHQGHEGFSIVFDKGKEIGVFYCDFERYPEIEVMKVSDSTEEFLDSIKFT